MKPCAQSAAQPALRQRFFAGDSTAGARQPGTLANARGQ
jgi:hypothetical protein